LQIHRNVEELKKVVDPKILPKEYGGEVPLSEMIGTGILLAILSRLK